MAYEVTTLYREPVSQGFIDYMAQYGYTPVWANQYETEEAQHVMGVNGQGVRALFYWDNGAFSGPFPASPA